LNYLYPISSFRLLVNSSIEFNKRLMLYQKRDFVLQLENYTFHSVKYNKVIISKKHYTRILQLHYNISTTDHR